MTTSIQWTDETWNPVRGCSLVSAGCTNCYAMKQAHRFNFPGGPYEGLTRLTERGPVWTGEVKLVREALDAPLHWKKPRRVFVNSMGDLFHEDVSADFVGRVWNTMRDSPRHTFQILTKRPARMLEFVLSQRGYSQHRDEPKRFYPYEPLPNVWLGVSVEDQETAMKRIPWLLQAPAAVRFLSVEPMLAEIALPWLTLQKIRWVIVGGESGPSARPCNIEWVRDIVRQCHAAGVACFVKQIGSSPCYGEMPLPSPRDRKGGDPLEWPIDLRLREFPA